MARKTIKSLEDFIDKLQKRVVDMVNNENRLIDEAEKVGFKRGLARGKIKAINVLNDIIAEEIAVRYEAIEDEQKTALRLTTEALLYSQSTKIRLMEVL